MIGFKDLVQNFKDGLPELKDIGKEGLGILGEGAKIVGGVALKGAALTAKAAGSIAAEGVKCALGSDGLKLTESNANTLHGYTDWTLDDVKSDCDYMAMFKRAMEELVEKRKYDDYVWRIDHFCNCVPYSARVDKIVKDPEKADKTVLWCLNFRGVTVNDEKGLRKEDRDVKLVISTPNARQLAWNGSALEEGYEILRYGTRDDGSQQHSERGCAFGSFLGVAFLRDYHEFVDGEQEAVGCVNDVASLKDVETVNVKANTFLKFTAYRAIVASSELVPEWKGKVMGMVCGVPLADVDDANEFIKKVCAILKHKYCGDWVRKDVSGFFERGKRFLYTLSINGGIVYLVQTKEGSLELIAVAGAYDKYRTAVDAAYKDTAEYKQELAAEQEREAELERKENERKAEIAKREKAKKEAEALKERKRQEELAARRTELSNALDAL